MTPALAVATSGAATLVAVVAVVVASRRLRIVRRVAFPLYVAALAGGLKAYLVLVGETSGVLGLTLAWILVFLVAVLVLRIVGLYVFDVYLYSHRGVRLPPLLPAVTMGVAYFVVAIVTLRLTFENLSLLPLLTTSAVTSLVLGLALQPILGNFFSGLVITLEQPFRINDWIRYQEIEGRVAKVTWRTTHLRTRENDTVVVPNSRIADSEIVNYFLPHPLHMDRIYVGIHYRTPPYRVKQALLDVADRVESVLKKPSPAVYLHSFDESAITYELRIWIEDIANRPRIASHVRSEIWEELQRRNMTIPFPIRTLEIEPRAGRLEIAPLRRREAEEEDTGAPPPARLYVYRGPDRGRSCDLDGEGVTVGRSSSCGFNIQEPHASKQHFRVEWRDGAYRAADLGSHHGTQVNGQAIEERALTHLDHVTIGGTVIIFECEPEHA